MKSWRNVLVLVLLLIATQNISAATYTVTKIADTADGTCDADCSLREAVVAAGATADNDTIVFSTLFNSAQTIVLSLSDIIVTNNGTLTVTGPGANLLTVSGNSVSRVFTNNTGAVTTISGLRITGGTGISTVTTGRGGGVYNNGGTLTLNNVVVTGNSAANGGGFNTAGNGTTTIINSTISANTVTGSGGGAQNFSGSTLNVIGSTFSGNTSNSTTTGGGALQANGTLNIANSTFSGNRAQGGTGGAFYYNGTVITLNNVTIANNTSTGGAGGFHKTTVNPANIRNTIIAGNSGDAASPDALGVFNSLGNNLIGAVAGSSGWITSDLQNRAAWLAPLANNGGATQTHALLQYSAAVNGGQNCVTDASCSSGNPPQALTTDQRGTGFPRLVGSAVDIGAFESNFTAVVRPPRFDFDGDAKSDYGIFRASNGTWYLQRSTAGFSATQFGLSTDKIVPEDYDGDGKTDIAVWRETGNNVAGRAYFYILRSSDNSLQSSIFGTTGDNPSIVGDYDGDGKADLAVFRPSDAVNIPCNAGASVWYYRPSSATSFIDYRYECWGKPGDTPTAGDYDGDGKNDLAVFRPSDSVWYIRRSSDNQPRYERWGTATDKKVQADYDGDGKTDLAVFRNGVWQILNSSNNQARYEYWGIGTDQLVAGDYDGDGKNDPTVWRNGVFYTLGSANNQAVYFNFGTTGDTPVGSAFWGN